MSNQSGENLILSPEEAQKAAHEEAERRKGLEESLGIASSKIRNRFKLPLHEMVENAAADLPEELRNEVMRSFEPIRDFCEEFQKSAITEEELQKLQEAGAPQELLEKIRGRQIAPAKVDEFLKGQVEKTSRQIHNSFMADMGRDEEGREVSMPNKNFSRLQIQQEINRLLEKDQSPESLKKIARISMDLNNLKKANDYNGSHEKGDRYLRMVRRVIAAKDLHAFAEKLNVKVVSYARVGGDEFDLIGIGDNSLENLNLVMEEIKSRITKNKEAAEIVDFTDEKVILHYGGITGKEETEFYKKSGEERQVILDKIKQEIPDGFAFIANVSCGAATLYDAMMDPENDKDGENKINPDEDYGRILKKMMGCLFNTSDRRMQKNKDTFKQSLAKGNDFERMMYRISTRDIEELKRVRLSQKKDQKIALLNQINDRQKYLTGLIQLGAAENVLENGRHEIAVAEEELKKIEDDLKTME